MLLRSAVLVPALLVTSSLQAAPRPLPPPGWHGAVGAALNVSRVESNELVDDKADQIDDLGAPSSYRRVTPIPRIELTYRFAESPTQIVFGHHINDALRLDHSRLFGVRHQSAEAGFLAAALVYSGVVNSEVWEDPYLTGGERDETARTSRGIRLSWEQVFNTPWLAEFTHRRVDIDNEASGTDPSLGLSPEETALLDRSGDVTYGRLGYEWTLPSAWSLTPSVIWTQHDLDGAAVSGRARGLRLDAQHMSGDYLLMGSVLALRFEADAGNPVFDGEAGDATDLMATLQVVRNNLFDRRFLAGFAMLSAGEADSRIDFHDARAMALTTGVNLRF
jgi:hypothetical protein